MGFELKGKNVLVTGGAGFIGSHLVDALIKESPVKIVVIDNLFLGKEENLDNAKKNFSGLKFIKASAADESIVRKIVEENKIEVVFNLAVIPLPASLERPKFCSDENAAITLNILELLREKKIETLVHFSSSEVYGSLAEGLLNENNALDPHTPYAASKAACDHLVQSYAKTFGLDTLIVRPFNNYGPRQNDKSYAGVIPLTARRILHNEKPIIFGDGKQTRDFIYVEDTAKAVIELFKNKNARGKIVNLGSGKEISVNELIDAICKIRDYNNGVEYKPARIGDVRRHQADMSLAKELIGFEPKTNFMEGLRNTLDYYKAINS